MKVNLLIFQFVLTLIMVHAEIDPSWIHPHAWATADPGKEVASFTNKPAGPEEKAVAIFYKKLIRNIFNRNQMMFNEISNQYERVVKFRITEEQLEILHTTEDVYTLDTVVSQILFASKTSASALTDNFTNISGAFGAIFQRIWSSPELRFIFVTISVLMALWYIAMKYNFSWIKIIFLSIFAMILFGFIHTYYECNKELEVDELLKLIEANDPCEEHLKEKERSWFWNLFAKSKKQECADHIKNSHKTKLPFCRPDKVLLIYLNDITFHQIEAFLTKTGKAFQNSFGSIGIIPTAVVSCILIYLLSAWFTPLCKNFFEYLRHITLSDSQQQQQQPAPIATEPHMNKLSNEVLNKILSICQNSPKSNAMEQSGVEVLETVPIKNEDKKAIKDGPGPSNVQSEKSSKETLETVPIKNEDKKAIKNRPGPSNIQPKKSLKADHIVENGAEWEMVVKESNSKNDISKVEDEIEPNEQESSHSDIEDRVELS